MNVDAKLKLHVFGLWSGVAFLVLIFVAMAFLAKFFPPPSPALNTDQVVALFTENATGIRLAMILLMIAATFYAIFISLVAHYVSIAEKHVGLLTLMVALSGGLNLLAFAFPALFWIVAAFRPERNPELVQLLYDLGWLPFMGLIGPIILLLIATAVTAFVDEREKPLFPRWFGYFNFFAITVYLPGQLIFFFREGVFAWNGLVGFWLPAVDFFGQLLLTLYFVWLAVNAERAKIRD